VCVRTVAAPAAPSAAAIKALGSFDELGRMSRWPVKYSVQRLAMWVLWMQFERGRVYSEREVNAVLKAWHTWGDHVTLRRELINDRLLTRKSDGSQYRKLPARPNDDARAVMAAWRARVDGSPRAATKPRTV
jgi:hypothetical protein